MSGNGGHPARLRKGATLSAKHSCLHRGSLYRNRGVLLFLGVAATGEVPVVACAGVSFPRDLRLPIDAGGKRCRGQSLRGLWRRLYRLFDLLALGDRRRAAGQMGYYRSRRLSRGSHDHSPSGRELCDAGQFSVQASRIIFWRLAVFSYCRV